MPIYEYRCLACQRTFEALRKAGDAPLSECRFCGSNKIEKLVSSFAVVVHDGQRATPNRPVVEREPCFGIDATVPRTFKHPNMGFRPVVRGKLPKIDVMTAKKKR